MWIIKKIYLVTGSTGFIGKWLCKELENRGLEYCCFKGDIRKPGIDLQYFNGVFHLAAKKDFSINQYGCYETNIMGTLNLCREISSYCRFLFVSSGRVTLGLKDKYTASKIAAEVIVRAERNDYIIVRQFNTLGPGKTGKELLVEEAQQIAKGITPTIHHPFCSRPFIDVRDAVRIYVDMMLDPPIDRIQNVSSLYSIQVSELVNKYIKEGNAYAAETNDISKVSPYMNPIYQQKISPHDSFKDMIDAAKRY